MKKFLIIGNSNAITQKNIFPHIASGEWFVRTANGKISFVMYFTNGDGEVKKVPSVWFTNLDSRHLYQTLELTKAYDPEKYPKYDNYNAIEVDRIKDIPYDYDGIMGVPISIVLFSPYQFEIIGSFNNSSLKEKAEEGYVLSNDTPTIINGVEKVWNGPVVNKQPLYKRICIKRISK